MPLLVRKPIVKKMKIENVLSQNTINYYHIFNITFESEGEFNVKDNEMNLVREIFPEYQISDNRLMGNYDPGHPDFMLKRGIETIYAEVKTMNNGLSKHQLTWLKNNPNKLIKIIYVDSSIRKNGHASNRNRILKEFYFSRIPLSITKISKILKDIHTNTIQRHINYLFTWGDIIMESMNIGVNKSEKRYLITEQGIEKYEKT